MAVSNIFSESWIYLRGLCASCVFFEFTVVDGEVWPEVTAVLQWWNTAARYKKDELHLCTQCRLSWKTQANLKFVMLYHTQINEGPLSWNLTPTPSAIVRKLYYIYLTRANTVSEDSAGDGAITTSGSPSSTSSQSIWMWKNTGQKHLKTDWAILIHLTS